MKLEINNNYYEIIENVKDAVDEEIIKDKLTDYFEPFDYVVGDWAYGKLRLKGFNNKNNKNFKSINDYSKVHDYIANDCAYGCRYFILKKIEKK